MVTKKVKFNFSDNIQENVQKFCNVAMRYDFDMDLVSGRYVIDANNKIIRDFLIFPTLIHLLFSIFLL